MKQRNDTIDILKGIGIIIMIMGHLGFGEPFSIYIHAFNMPLFFAISGFLFVPESYPSIGKLIVKKTRRLLIPYLFFGFVNIAIAIAVQDGFSVQSAVSSLLWTNNSGLAISGALWFLTSLFIAEMVFYFISKVKNIYLICLLSMFIGITATYITIVLPFSMKQGFVGLSFMGCGYLYRKLKDSSFVLKIEKCSIWIIVILGILNAAAIFYNGLVNMRKNSYSNRFLFWLNALITVYLMLLVVKRWISYRKDKEFWFERIVKYIGKNSITFVCINETAILLVNFLFGQLVFNNFIFKLIIKLLKYSLVIGILSGIFELMNRTPLRVMLGEKMIQRKKNDA